MNCVKSHAVRYLNLRSGHGIHPQQFCTSVPIYLLTIREVKARDPSERDLKFCQMIKKQSHMHQDRTRQGISRTGRSHCYPLRHHPIPDPHTPFTTSIRNELPTPLISFRNPNARKAPVSAASQISPPSPPKKTQTQSIDQAKKRSLCFIHRVIIKTTNDKLSSTQAPCNKDQI